MDETITPKPISAAHAGITRRRSRRRSFRSERRARKAVRARSARERPQAGKRRITWNWEERPTKYIAVARPRVPEKASITLVTRSVSRRTKPIADTRSAARYVA